MDVDTTIERITKDVVDEASKIAADESAKATNEEDTKDTTVENNNRSVEATGGILAQGAPSADSAMRVLAAGKAGINEHPSTTEVPPSSRYLKIGNDLFVSTLGHQASTRPPKEKFLMMRSSLWLGLKSLMNCAPTEVDPNNISFTNPWVTTSRNTKHTTTVVQRSWTPGWPSSAMHKRSSRSMWRRRKSGTRRAFQI